MLKLTKEDEEYLRENLRYDPETGRLWWTKPFSHRRLDRPAGGKGEGGYLIITIKTPSRRYLLRCHRICWLLYYGFWPNNLLDHINGNRSDNRISNLRLASNQQNQRNRKVRINSSSKYKGVSWHERNQKWQVYVGVNSKNTNLGYYNSEEEAARAYDKAAREHYGEYARLNFPEEHEQGATHGHDL